MRSNTLLAGFLWMMGLHLEKLTLLSPKVIMSQVVPHVGKEGIPILSQQVSLTAAEYERFV